MNPRRLLRVLIHKLRAGEHPLVVEPPVRKNPGRLAENPVPYAIAHVVRFRRYLGVRWRGGGYGLALYVVRWGHSETGPERASQYRGVVQFQSVSYKNYAHRGMYNSPSLETGVVPSEWARRQASWIRVGLRHMAWTVRGVERGLPHLPALTCPPWEEL